MNIKQIAELIQGELLNENFSEQEFLYAFSSDLMSDVLRWPRENMLLITGLATIQAIRTAELSNIDCVIFARGKKVTDEMLELAQESDIAVITCPSSMFEISGKLYANGIKAVY
ncbi:conserved hypothetical protein [uncultured Paludibacter sp.]|uniref:DRTGG domain-containing protein n=1 Tax=uncultured Paludibacter sp. TaxID=497635 RepID=A0A653ACM3_9BACT|nr:conserved hypothetical protein [uncultured Paludibacter sp.]